MKKLISMISSLVFAVSANATLISLEFDQDQYEVGDVVNANVVISDIETEFGFQKLLGSFSMDMSYDESLVAFNQVTFGDKLNGGDAFESMTTSIDSMGSLFIEEVSFSFDLFSFQDGLPSYTLATVQFTALADGTGTPSFTNIALANDFGEAFNTVSSTSAPLAIGNVQAIPEPHMLALVLPFMLLLARKRS